MNDENKIKGLGGDAGRFVAEVRRSSKSWKETVAKLPTIEIDVSDLSPSEYFALLQIRGNMPTTTADHVAKMKEVELGFSRAQQIALMEDGLDGLIARGVVFHDPDDKNSYSLYPKVRIVSPMKSRSEALAINEQLTGSRRFKL